MNYNNKDITIVFYNEDEETYRAGNIVQGHVEFNFETARTVKKMCIKIIGECNTQCTKIKHGDKKNHDNDEKVKYSGSSIIVQDQLTIVDSPRKIQAGNYKQEFIFRLPNDAPASYSSDNGSISYYIKTVMDIQNSTRREGAIFPFTVAPSLIDLRYRNDLFEKRWLEIKNSFNGLLYCCGKPREIIITANINKTGYKPGDTIAVRLEVDNWSKVAVNAVKVSLCRKQTYMFESPSNEKEVKMEFIALLQTKPVKKFSCEWFEQEVVVPSNLVIRDFRRSGLIKEEFVLLVKASLDGPYFDMEGEIPIELGDFA